MMWLQIWFRKEGNPRQMILLKHSDGGYEATNTMIGIFQTIGKMCESMAGNSVQYQNVKL